MKSRTFIFLVGILALAALACNAAGLGADSRAEETESQPPDASGQPAEGQAGVDQDQTAGQAPGEQAAGGQVQQVGRPVGIREGLASLNSYRLLMNVINNGPTPQDINETRTEIRYSADDDARYTRSDSVQGTADDPGPYVSLEENYQIGLQTCSVSTYEDGTAEASPTELTPLAHDMATAATNLFDFNITVENPSPAGSETINGVPSDHYTFQITGLGDYSGQEVTQADGEYWIAQDGNYLVKYTLVLEARTAPEGDPAAEVQFSEYTFDLLEVNQPQPISMPPDCLVETTE